MSARICKILLSPMLNAWFLDSPNSPFSILSVCATFLLIDSCSLQPREWRNDVQRTPKSGLIREMGRRSFYLCREYMSSFTVTQTLIMRPCATLTFAGILVFFMPDDMRQTKVLAYTLVCSLLAKTVSLACCLVLCRSIKVALRSLKKGARAEIVSSLKRSNPWMQSQKPALQTPRRYCSRKMRTA